MKRIDGMVRTTVHQGGQVVTGGRSLAEESGGAFYQPTILTNVDMGMEAVRDEIFGPVQQIMLRSPLNTNVSVLPGGENETQTLLPCAVMLPWRQTYAGARCNAGVSFKGNPFGASKTRMQKKPSFIKE